MEKAAESSESDELCLEELIGPGLARDILAASSAVSPDQSEDDEFEEEDAANCSNAMKHNKEYRELSNVRGFVQSREMLAQVKLPDIFPIILTSSQLQLLADNLELAELNWVLMGCYVRFRMRRHVLELQKQPNMSNNFVVPITRIEQKKERLSTNKVLLVYFNNARIPIHRRKTGEPLTRIGVQHMWDRRELNLKAPNKLVLVSLLAMRELNIPWPSDEEIARKSTELSTALAKAESRCYQTVSSSSHSTSTTHLQRQSHYQQFPAGPSTSNVHHHLYGAFGQHPLPIMAMPSASSSAAIAANSPPFFYPYGPMMFNPMMAAFSSASTSAAAIPPPPPPSFFNNHCGPFWW